MKKTTNTLGRAYNRIKCPQQRRAARMHMETLKSVYEQREPLVVLEVAALLHHGKRGILNTDTAFSLFFDRLRPATALEVMSLLHYFLRHVQRIPHPTKKARCAQKIERAWIHIRERPPYRVIIGRAKNGNIRTALYRGAKGCPTK